MTLEQAVEWMILHVFEFIILKFMGHPLSIDGAYRIVNGRTEYEQELLKVGGIHGRAE